ncbi:Pectinesterase inhibitor domain [Macleaya cordata]|uniref:Pectinesterase inhibitor domain n=1 Tax=Macleaya cordata TaxID=56857 RepID=A0A200PM43_MACCD|nr:Pectinesterase inhibitor domain [Macleaya cordata]
MGKNDFASAWDIKKAATKDEVCSLTKNRNFCIQQLNSVPDQDLFNLGVYITNKIEVNAAGVGSKIRITLLPKATPAQKGHLSYCQGRYESALYANRKLIVQFADKDYNGAKKIALSAENYSTECENSFKSPPAGASPLTKENQELSDLFDIFVALCTFLLR